MQLPVFEVTLVDSEPFDVSIQQSEATRWEIEQSARGWPDKTEAWNLWTTFVAFNASRRLGRIPADMTFDAFTDLAVRIDIKAVAEADPTQPDPTPDSSSS
jgi:hypothetical protein